MRETSTNLQTTTRTTAKTTSVGAIFLWNGIKTLTNLDSRQLRLQIINAVGPLMTNSESPAAASVTL